MSILASLTSVAARLPSTCAVCQSWPARPVCTACRARFAAPVRRCDTCARELVPGPTRCGRCLADPPPLDACFAAVGYRYPWAELIAVFKFRKQPGLAGQLASLISGIPGVPEALARADIVLPMPLSRRRLAERGYNQALLLARQLAPTKAEAKILLRTQDTPPQLALDRQARVANVRHAFAVDPLLAARVSGGRVVLVDDVMTSGASLFAAACALRASGAASVSAVVLARTLDSTD